jgi:hypothetical protein
LNRALANRARHVVGSIVVEETGGGNLRISKTHTPSAAIVIERADFDDLMVALNTILKKRVP